MKVIFFSVVRIWFLKHKRPTWCHLLFYFTSYVLNMFRILIYTSSGACDYSVELSHWSYCSWFDVCWSFGVVVLEWYPCCRLLCAQHVSDINISIIRNLRIFCWIITLVVLFLVWCVLEFWCGWVGVVSVLQAEAQVQLATRIPFQTNHTKTPMWQFNRIVASSWWRIY